jgi:hypothetical protein
MTTLTEIRKQATEVVLRKLVERGYGVNAAERRVLDAHIAAAVVRHVEKAQEAPRARHETLVEKIARAQDYGTVLTESIAAYAAAHNVSKSVAVERVLMSPQVSEYHRLDKALAAAQREAVMHAALGKLGARPRFPTKGPHEQQEELNASPGDENVIADVNDLIQRIAANQLRAHPAMTRAHAIERAMHHPDVVSAHVAEKRRKGL